MFRKIYGPTHVIGMWFIRKTSVMNNKNNANIVVNKTYPML